MITRLSEVERKALDQGFSELRVTGEMSWALRGAPGCERLVEYEQNLNHFFPQSRAIAICQYEEGTFPAEVLLAAIKAHPLVALGEFVGKNPFYMPPGEQHRPPTPEDELKRVLNFFMDKERRETWLTAEGRALERRLSVEKDRFQRLVRTMPAILCVLTPKGDTLYVNDWITVVTGYRPEELLGRNWWEVFYPGELRTQVDRLYERLKRSGDVADYAMTLRTKRGTTRIISWSSANRWGPDGQLLEVVGIGVDITQRQEEAARVQRLYQEAERRRQWLSALREMDRALTGASDLQDVLEKALDQALSHLSLDLGCVCLCGEGYEGLSLAAARNFPEELHPLLCGEPKEGLAWAALDLGSPLVISDLRRSPLLEEDARAEMEELGLRCAAILPLVMEGEAVGVLILAGRSPHLFEQEEVEFLSSLADQVAVAIARAHLWERLRESEARFRRLAEGAWDAIFRIEFGKGLTYINKAWTRLLGHSREEILADPELLVRCLLPEHRGELDELIKQAQTGEKGLPHRVGPWRYRRKDGKEVWIEYNIVLVHDEQGRVVAVEGIGRDVTDRVRAEEELRRQREFVEGLLETAGVWINVLDAQGNVILWNREAEVISGYTKEEVLGHKGIWEWLYPDPAYREQVFQRAMAVMRGEAKDQPRETRIRRKDGSVRIISWHSRSLIGPDGKPAGCITVGHDITELKEIQEALRASEARYREIVELSPDGIFTADLSGRFLSVNPAICESLGYSAQELVGKNLTEIISPASRVLFEKRAARIARGEWIREPAEYEVLTKSGRRLWVEVVSAPIQRDGEIVGFLGIARDVTARKEAEAALAREREFAERLIEAANVWINVVDPDGRVLLWNKEAERISGYSAAEVVGSARVWEFLYPDPDYRADVQARVQATLAGEEVSGTLETVIRRKDGETRRIAWFGRPLHDEAGQMIGLLAVGHDVTEARSLAQERERRLRELALLHRASEAFVLYGDDPKRYAREVLKSLGRFLRFRYAALALVDEGTKLLRALARIAPEGAEPTPLGQKLIQEGQVSGEGLAGWVARYGTTLRLGAVREDPRYVAVWPEVRSGLYVPLRAGERTVGVLIVESDKENAFTPEDERLLVTLAGQVAAGLERTLLRGVIQAMPLRMAEGLARFLAQRDAYTESHGEVVAQWAVATARELGLPEEEIVQIQYGALLHDIGKVAIPDAVLRKPDPLTTDEWAEVWCHPDQGADLVAAIPGLAKAAQYIREHHERLDGSGYPRGLVGDEISMGARIIAVADVYHALISDRPYRPAIPPEKAKPILRREAETGRLDKRVVEAFLRILGADHG
jgi:PAS domain S-box-containing protein